MRLILERVVAPRIGPGGPSEVVERHGVDTELREPKGELLVIRVQAANVGEDDDPGARRLGGSGTERLEAVAVVGGQEQRGPVKRPAGDRGDGRPAVEVEAHAA